jgi:pimeloyl-ACP methyl ester carboxylesterase
VKRIFSARRRKASGVPVLVYLHEGLGCIEHWKDFPESLCEATGLDGLVYDRKGYGGSDDLEGNWEKDYLVGEAGRDLPALLKAAGIEAAILVGHSDGGSIALLAAALTEGLVAAVVAEAAHVFVEDETVRGIEEFMKIYEQKGLREKLARFHGEKIDAVVGRWSSTWLSSHFRDWNIESYLSQIDCPVLAIQGAEDEYATARQVEAIAKGVSGPVFAEIVPNCRHTPHFQARERVISLICDFIESLPR